MLPPEYMAGIADEAEKAAAMLHDNIMKAIIERMMARAGRGEKFMLTATDKWNIETIQQAGYLYDDILKEISSMSGQTDKAVKRAMVRAGVRALEYDQKIYDKLGIPPIDIRKSPQYMGMMEADYMATKGTMENLTRTTADSAQRTFINECDNIYMAVTRGYDTLGNMIAKAVEKISDNDGIYITYPSGKITSVEAAVARCVRTGVAQMAGHVSEQRARDTGCEHYLVSSHLGARPTHQKWQGKVYKINGSDDEYENFREATGYGTGAGLCGWNCRHSFSPFFPEFMKNNQEQYSVTENEEEYKRRQEEKRKQRERRYIKRKQTAFKTAVECTDDESVKKVLEEKGKQYKNGLNKQKGTVANKSDNGIISGARNPDGKAATEHARRYYGLVRSMKTDVCRISKATGFEEKDIQKIKEYIFVEKHDLGGNEPKQFDPDYMIAESWQRLIEGKPEKHDITLIKHELMESELMENGYCQSDAHIISSGKYNYAKEAREYYGKIKKYKKER